MSLLFASGSTKPQYPYDQWYGIQGDFNSTDPKLTRVGNLDLHRTLPIQKKLKRVVEATAGGLKYYLNDNDSRKKTGGTTANIDGTDGNVMLEKPEYYFRLELNGTKWIRAFSEYPLPGFTKMTRKFISPWFATVDLTTNSAVSASFLTWNGNDIARDANGFVVYTPNAANFRGGNGSADSAWDGTAKSMIGMARTNIGKSTMRLYCKNNTHVGAYRAYTEIAWLMRCEYATLNVRDVYTETLTTDGFKQGCLGRGPQVDSNQWNTFITYRPFIPSGVTAVLGNNTGKVDYTIKSWNGGADKVVQVTSYRGLETPYEYIQMMVDDAFVNHMADVSTVYVCEDKTKFYSPADAALEFPDGYVSVSNLPRSSGYVVQQSHSIEGYSFPSTSSGTSGLGLGDAFTTSIDNGFTTPASYGLKFGGLAVLGQNGGFGACNAIGYNGYVYYYTGFRLCRF